MLNVFLKESIHPSAIEFLQRYARILKRDEELEWADAVLTRNLRIDSSFIDKAKSLKVIGIHGTGTDGVDIASAQVRGIEVFCTPHINAQSVAELNVALALQLSRKLTYVRQYLQQNAPKALQGIELMDKQAGFLGTGEIAQRTAKILCDGFGMQANGYSPSYTPKKANGKRIAYAADLKTVLQKADYFFVCTPLNKETYNLVDAEQLTHMKQSAYLINCARGGVVDEVALEEALRKKKIAGAACDVFYNEPIQPQHPLLRLENFIATPHIGANTEEALYRVGMEVAQGIVQRLNGEKEVDCAGKTITVGRNQRNL